MKRKKIIPYPFQKKGVYKIWKFNGLAIIGDPMGLGKTVQACEYARIYKNKRPIVVVCKVSGRSIWEEHFFHILGAHCDILTGRTEDTDRKQQRITIINWDIIHPWERYLKLLGGCSEESLLILDEIHSIKNSSANRTKAIRRVAKHFKFRIGISATLAMTKPDDIWIPCNTIQPTFYPERLLFRFEFCKPKINQWGAWDYSGATHTKKLHKILKKTILIRRKKVTSAPKHRTVIPMECDLTEYKEAEKNFAAWLRKSKTKKERKKIMKAAVLQKHNHLKRLASRLKFEAVQQWIKDFSEDSDESLLLWAYHTNIIRQLQKTCTTKNSVIYDGKVSPKKKEEAVKRFQNKDARFFIGQIRSASESLTLTTARSAAFVELDYNPAIIEQAEDRIWGRLDGTQDLPANIYYLIATNTIEEDLCEIIQSRSEVTKAILDGKKDTTNTLTIHDMLERSIRRRNV